QAHRAEAHPVDGAVAELPGSCGAGVRLVGGRHVLSVRAGSGACQGLAASCRSGHGAAGSVRIDGVRMSDGLVRAGESVTIVRGDEALCRRARRLFAADTVLARAAAGRTSWVADHQPDAIAGRLGEVRIRKI